MLSWNKGNSLFEKKRDDISITLDRHKPNIFAIHEANFNSQVNRGFKNYNLEYKTLNDRCTDARTILLIKQGIQYKRRCEYENENISSI